MDGVTEDQAIEAAQDDELIIPQIHYGSILKRAGLIVVRQWWLLVATLAAVLGTTLMAQQVARFEYLNGPLEWPVSWLQWIVIWVVGALVYVVTLQTAYLAERGKNGGPFDAWDAIEPVLKTVAAAYIVRTVIQSLVLGNLRHYLMDPLWAPILDPEQNIMLDRSTRLMNMWLGTAGSFAFLALHTLAHFWTEVANCLILFGDEALWPAFRCAWQSLTQHAGKYFRFWLTSLGVQAIAFIIAMPLLLLMNAGILQESTYELLQQAIFAPLSAYLLVAFALFFLDLNPGISRVLPVDLDEIEDDEVETETAG